MTAERSLSDEAIRNLLEKRAGRPDVVGRLAAARSVAAATPQRGRSRFAIGSGGTPTLVAGAVLSALVAVLLAVGLASRLPSSGTPSGSPPTPSGPSSPNLSPLPIEAAGPLVLTVDELDGLIAMDPAALNGRLLVIDGVINGTGVLCQSSPGGQCFAPTAYLDRSNPRLDVGPVAALGPGPWSGGTAPPLAGPFAATLVNGKSLVYRGPVTTTPALDALLPSQLPDASTVGSGGELKDWLVHGWISGLGVVFSCPSVPAPALTSGQQYGCGGLGAFLADDPRQPVTVTSSGFSVDAGAGSVELQDGAYQEYAPAPESSGAQTRPEEATFLVQDTPVAPCLGPQSCAPVAGHWTVVARVDPLPVVVVPPAPSPTPSASPQPIVPLTAEDLNTLFAKVPQQMSRLQLVITGTIVSSPERCIYLPACKDRVVLLGTYAPVLEIYPLPSVHLPSHLPFKGTFAAELTDAWTLNYEGAVTTTANGGPIMPSELPARTISADPDSLWLVQGWIAGLEAALPCPIAPGSPQTGPQYGCGSTASLSDTDSQPVSDLQLKVPGDGVQVQNGSYDDFAPDPQSSGYNSQPEQATFLVKLASVPCPPGILCSLETGHQWQIIARIDPWPVPALP